MITNNYPQLQSNQVITIDPKVQKILKNIPPPPAPPTYAQRIVLTGVQATFGYWIGYGIAKLGFSKGIQPVDFARMSCASSVIRPALSHRVKSLLGCNENAPIRNIAELFITSIGTNLISFGLCQALGTQIDLNSLLKNTVVSVSFAAVSELLLATVKEKTPEEVNWMADEEEMALIEEESEDIKEKNEITDEEKNNLENLTLTENKMKVSKRNLDH